MRIQVISYMRGQVKHMGLQMEELYRISGISRQCYHKLIHRQHDDALMWQRFVEMVIEYRKERPRSSARKIHHSLKITEVGINRFERFISSQGLSVKRHRSFIKTTYSGAVRYPNLVNGLEVTGINQVWVSDITYFLIHNMTLYIVLIMDVYSRRIIGYSGSNNMLTINNQEALQMAFYLRGKKKFDNLIHHSDKGSQYGSKNYTTMLLNANITISMADNCLENPYAERINGTIKNDYMIAYNIENQRDFQRALSKSVKLYNTYPHGELKEWQSPIEFETSLRNSTGQSQEVMKLYDFRK